MFRMSSATDGLWVLLRMHQGVADGMPYLAPTAAKRPGQANCSRSVREFSVFSLQFAVTASGGTFCSPRKPHPENPKMSRNLSSLSFRQGSEKNLFERMVAAADEAGTAEKAGFVHGLGKESLFGDALTLGAVSFYDFLKKENEGKKVFVCNGSACLCARTQDVLHGRLTGFFKEEEIGHI